VSAHYFFGQFYHRKKLVSCCMLSGYSPPLYILVTLNAVVNMDTLTGSLFGSRVHSMLQKLAQFTDVSCCLVVGGLSSKVGFA
jgi:hypothetical protein